MPSAWSVRPSSVSVAVHFVASTPGTMVVLSGSPPMVAVIELSGSSDTIVRVMVSPTFASVGFELSDAIVTVSKVGFFVSIVTVSLPA